MKPVLFCAALFLVGISSGRALAQTSVTLTASPAVTVFGHPVTLAAVVSSPAGASGTMTFYQGSRLLGSQPVVNGKATLVTSQIQAGARSIKAFYSGDGTHGAATSPIASETVAALAGIGFPTAASIASGSVPVWTAVGDFNLDGKQDVAVLTATNLYIFLGNGNGTFGVPGIYGAGGNATCVAVGDFNGDGKPDLVVLNSDVSTDAGLGYVFLGNGNGSFKQPTTSFATGTGPFDVVVADFNLDGKADIATANLGTAEDVSILLGNGDGTFAPYTSISTGADTGAAGIAVADFNRDGIPDLAVAEENLVILTGVGNGSFGITSTLLVGNNPQTSALSDVEIGDFNGDGIFDVVVPDFIGNTVSVFLGEGNGGFQQQIVSQAGNSPFFLSVGDFNGDGVADLAVLDIGFVGTTAAQVGVMLGLGDGLFSTLNPFTAGSSPNMLAQGEFNGDGIADIVYPDQGNFGTNPGALGVMIGSPCTVILNGGSPLSTAFDSTGGAPTYNIATGASSCGWQVISSVPWVTAVPSSGTGNHTVNVSVAVNATGADRTANILVAGQSGTVLQDFTAQVFSDVIPSNAYFDSVNLLAAKGITTGCSADDYCPTQNVTRAQMAIFIVRTVLGTDNFTYSQTPLFTDVPANGYGFPWIQKLAEMNITTGCAPNLFCPNSSITRAEMAVFIIRARYGAATNFSYFSTPIFTDEPFGSFAFAWVQRMAEDTITTGCAPSLYCPSNPVDRGDMATFIMRGGFNQLLPATEPVITSVSPRTLTHGTTGTFTVTGVNTNFVQGQTVIYGINGAVVHSVTVMSPTTLTASITAPLVTQQQPMALYVIGTPEAVYPNAIAVP